MKKKIILTLITVSLGLVGVFTCDKLSEYNNNIKNNIANIKVLEDIISEQNEKIIKTSKIILEVNKEKEEIKETSEKELNKLNIEIDELKEEIDRLK